MSERSVDIQQSVNGKPSFSVVVDFHPVLYVHKLLQVEQEMNVE